MRIALAVPVALLLLHERYLAALILFFVAGVSDGLDGYLAKRFNWRSRLGSVLDPIGDKLLLVATYLALGWTGFIPLWLVVAVLARDIVVLGGALAFHFLIGRYEMAPSLVSKVNTFAQIVLVLAVVVSLAGAALPEWFINAIMSVVFVTTLWSGVDYVWTWGRRAWQARARSHHE